MRQLLGNLRDADGALVASIADLEELLTGQEALFRRGQVQGDLRTDVSPRTMALTYQAAVDAMIERLQSDPALDAEACADELTTLLLGGLIARPA